MVARAHHDRGREHHVKAREPAVPPAHRGAPDRQEHPHRPGEVEARHRRVLVGVRSDSRRLRPGAPRTGPGHDVRHADTGKQAGRCDRQQHEHAQRDHIHRDQRGSRTPVSGWGEQVDDDQDADRDRHVREVVVKRQPLPQADVWRHRQVDPALHVEVQDPLGGEQPVAALHRGDRVDTGEIGDPVVGDDEEQHESQLAVPRRSLRAAAAEPSRHLANPSPRTGWMAR